MKRLVRNESLAFLGYMKNVLEQAGIACLLKNEQLAGGLGEIPFLECLPELWVVQDGELARAQALLADLQRVEPGAAEWICALCGESNEGQFAACWQCGRADDRKG